MDLDGVLSRSHFDVLFRPHSRRKPMAPFSASLRLNDNFMIRCYHPLTYRATLPSRVHCGRFPSHQSTKMEALMEEVHLMQERDPAAKAIVFSQVSPPPMTTFKYTRLNYLVVLHRRPLASFSAVPDPFLISSRFECLIACSGAFYTSSALVRTTAPCAL